MPACSHSLLVLSHPVSLRAPQTRDTLRARNPPVASIRRCPSSSRVECSLPPSTCQRLEQYINAPAIDRTYSSRFDVSYAPLHACTPSHQWTRDRVRHVRWAKGHVCSTYHHPSVTMISIKLHRSLDFHGGLGGIAVRFSCILLILLGHGGVSAAVEKPETVLMDFLAKPFAPSDGASIECLRASGVYLMELDRYTPWALQSKWNFYGPFWFSSFLERYSNVGRQFLGDCWFWVVFFFF